MFVGCGDSKIGDVGSSGSGSELIDRSSDSDDGDGAYGGAEAVDVEWAAGDYTVNA
jgi:hypothetical protein